MNEVEKIYNMGLDVGSTTAKVVLTDNEDNIVFTSYKRHNADIKGAVKNILSCVRQELGNIKTKLTLSGSAAMGLAERCSFAFVQEVMALNNYAKSIKNTLHTIIDIGGEDAKIIFLEKDALPDMRMNGNCAGGTGAFIDQMSAILNLSIADMDAMAQKSTRLYPIASRCGVFSKTDVQTLIARNIPLEDICASIFHAIAVQVVSALSRGKEIKEKILLAGGPLTFIKSLRQAFLDYLNVNEDALTDIQDNNLLVAKGCTFNSKSEVLSLEQIEAKLDADKSEPLTNAKGLPAIFSSEQEYRQWLEKKKNLADNSAPMRAYKGKAFLGIDSGSTTTKIVLIDKEGRIIFKYYNKNEGNPINAVIKGLQNLKKTVASEGAEIEICGGASTGYGEDLIKTAFSLNHSAVETIAHYTAARHILPQADFILDIGGQDMKAMYIEDGVLTRIELNEACSSGCGTFIETFANGLGYKVEDFASMALYSSNPCDLGTRCTVFMNSKVKQYLREGRSVEDISSGLSYSVVRNCLYKVLKLEGKSLGQNIVVQGGTMKNDSVVKALENLLQREVCRPSSPELMGAYGCALLSLQGEEKMLDLDALIASNDYSIKQLTCKGCENNCLVSAYKFSNGNVYYSGNRCEKIFSSSGTQTQRGDNIYKYKFDRTFRPYISGRQIVAEIGIPRALNMFEDYPFWNALFKECGIEPVLSDLSSYSTYERSLNQVMSENICFPAKLTHSHIDNLINKGIKHIFFPYVVYEKTNNEKENNTFNCPIVSSYNIVIKHLKEKHKDIKIDNPVFSFKDEALLRKNCRQYLADTFNIPSVLFDYAFSKALEYRNEFEQDLWEKNLEYYNKALKEDRPVILLAARPYHTDDLVQHSAGEIAAGLGVTVVNEDIARGEDYSSGDNSFIVSQWSYINRIENAACFVANQSDNVNYAQLTSFGCGPDAFLLDDIQDILRRSHKSATFLKIDDIQNPGALKLRIRSLSESIRMSAKQTQEPKEKIDFLDTKDFSVDEKHRKILAPFFTAYISPFLPELFKINGYDLEVLPLSDELSAEEGIKYANNEVCYPATLIVGDAIKALKSGKYDRNKVAFGITQTGGQCRATNYYAILRKAFVDAGFADVPVMSVNFGEDTAKKQDGFKLNWRITLPITLSAILFGDCLSKLYCSTIVRCDDKSKVEQLQNDYILKAKQLILERNQKAFQELLASAVQDFNSLLPNEISERKKVGIVGEIYLKYHPFANHNVQDWLIEQNIEVVPPSLMTFFIQTFVNRKVNKNYNIEKQSLPQFLMDFFYRLIKRKIDKFNKVLSDFKYYRPLDDIFALAEKSKGILPLYSQFGEGWLLPAEIVHMVENGVNTVVSLQPFGCIANHIISKGVENKIKELYPKLNYLALDFDNSVSQVNIKNRLILMLESID
ncbi:MAG: 2-hydroxyacyl-CoA dehydratase [Bacteroidales bacterium]|nr:2-hydroxyacyl-CoA dehydratase [Bacteroidales bacterium]